MPSTPRIPRGAGDRPRPGIWILLGLILLAFAAMRLLPRPHPPRTLRPAAPPQLRLHPAAPARTHRPAGRHTTPAAGPAAERPAVAPRCAIVIDDVGNNEAVLREFLDLDLPLTFAVLPQLEFSKQAAQAARDAGHTVLLHLPMEPHEASKDRFMGPGALTTAMSDAEIEAQVLDDLDSLGSVAGINNHMGSKASADLRVMKAVMRVAKQRALFFVDSVTTGKSVAGEAAREIGVALGRRDVFLDTDVAGEEGIRARLTSLIAQAKARGSAIGIGHAHPLTAQVLRAMSGEFASQGVRLVSVADLVASE